MSEVQNIDFNDYEESSFDTITPGEYEAYIYDTEIVTSSGGTPGVKMVFKIRDDVPQKHQKQQVFHTVWVTLPNGEKQGTIGMIKGYFRALGLETDFKFPNIATLQKFIADHFQAKAVRIRTGLKEYNGNQYAELKGMKESQAGGSAGSDPFAGAGKPINISEDDLPF
jgi:hypothetical protein